MMEWRAKRSIAAEELPDEFVAELRKPIDDQELAVLDHLMAVGEGVEVMIVGEPPDDLVSVIAAADYARWPQSKSGDE